ncbi:MAG: hypothetical protein NZ942_04095, partial [Candidatus Aenigmarchaeota archaeon]|nr:hypothetical protein [Candidatus Aenigmarchaeota archaeon]
MSDLKTVEGVVYCWQVLERTSPRPAVCGKCNLRLEGKKLSILTVENCPPYEVYKCQKEDGKTFFINTLGCK